MTVNVTELKKYQDKKVVVTRNLPDKPEAVEIEGTVQVSNDMGILIKPKGKTQFELIPLAEIEAVNFVQETDKALKPKTLKVVDYGQARAHLADRHGYTLAQVNKMTEKVAYEFHTSGDMNHTTLDVSHVHGDKDATPRAEAVAAASE